MAAGAGLAAVTWLSVGWAWAAVGLRSVGVCIAHEHQARLWWLREPQMSILYTGYIVVIFILRGKSKEVHKPTSGHLKNVSLFEFGPLLDISLLLVDHYILSEGCLPLLPSHTFDTLARPNRKLLVGWRQRLCLCLPQ